MIGRLLAASALVLSGMAMVGTPAAHACSCVPGDTASEAAGATHVFVGTVTGKGERSRGSVHDVDVSEVYKGEVPEVVEVHTGLGSCGLGSLPVGRPVAFFATSTRGDLVSGSCHGTAPATAELSRDLSAELGAPADRQGAGEPTGSPEAADQPDPGGDGAPLWPGLTVVLLVALGAGVWAARRTS